MKYEMEIHHYHHFPFIEKQATLAMLMFGLPILVGGEYLKRKEKTNENEEHIKRTDT